MPMHLALAVQNAIFVLFPMEIPEPVEICEQRGFAKSKRGSFSVTYRYNERLGLVEAIYDYNHEVRIQLSLIKTIIPKPKKDG